MPDDTLVITDHYSIYGILYQREGMTYATVGAMQNMFLNLADEFNCNPFLQGDWSDGFLIEFWSDSENILNLFVELERVGWKLIYE